MHCEKTCVILRSAVTACPERVRPRRTSRMGRIQTLLTAYIQRLLSGFFASFRMTRRVDGPLASTNTLSFRASRRRVEESSVAFFTHQPQIPPLRPLKRTPVGMTMCMSCGHCMPCRHCVCRTDIVCRTGIPDAQGSTIIRINKYIVIPSEPQASRGICGGLFHTSTTDPSTASAEADFGVGIVNAPK